MLTSIIGDDNRTTKDMDATLKGIVLTKGEIDKVFNEVLSINLGDGVSFKIISIKDIRLEDEYGGFRLNILASLNKNKTYITVELTTGDIITPREMKYSYNCIFENKKIPIMAYTIETILAEKFHAIMERGVLTTRLKDYYDMYVLMNGDYKIDDKNLVKAIESTFLNRNSKFAIDEFKMILEDLKDDRTMKKLWIEYQGKNTYANDIKYEETIHAINLIVKILERELISV